MSHTVIHTCDKTKDITLQFRILTILTALLVALSSCSETEEPVGVVSECPIYFVQASPPAGSPIDMDDTIVVTFDRVILDASVNVGTAVARGMTLTISGPWTPGVLNLVVKWGDSHGLVQVHGKHTLIYDVLPPDTEAPYIVYSSIKEGDIVDPNGWDPDAIDFDFLRIDVTFSEEVSGFIELLNEDGDNVGWLGRVQGNKGKLELVRGKELTGCGAKYVIAGKVSDEAGNTLEFKINFGTSIFGCFGVVR